MFKKEYFFVFALIGLSIVYVFLSLIVFLSRGKWSRAFNKKLAIGAMIVAFCAIINSQTPAFSRTVSPTLAPTPLYGTLEPTESPPPIPPYSTPVVQVSPAYQEVRTNQDFITDITVNSGTQKVAAYGMTVSYDDSLISVDTEKGSDGVSPGADGFVSAVNSSNPGEVVVTGFDVSGVGPGSNLELFTVHWTAGTTAGTTEIYLEIDELVDPTTNTIGNPYSMSGQVQIIELLLGDVDEDDDVDIIDALLVAQYYVNLNPDNFNPDAADVDASGAIDIVDALLIARKYVGSIDEFPGE
jgi:hypothetical protein